MIILTQIIAAEFKKLHLKSPMMLASKHKTYVIYKLTKDNQSLLLKLPSIPLSDTKKLATKLMLKEI